MARFKGPPLAAFGLTAGADVAALRAAFMTLCKRYHPAKYARFAPTTVRLANEVFLVMRRAHDDLARTLSGASTPPRRTATPPTGVPITGVGGVPHRTATPPTGGAERGPSLNPKLGPPAAADPRFERALEHLRERRWAQARPLLSELSAGAPTDVRYRAYLHYLRGWEAFELGKDGEARAEWRRALACDPGLGMAQWALQKTGLG